MSRLMHAGQAQQSTMLTRPFDVRAATEAFGDVGSSLNRADRSLRMNSTGENNRSERYVCSSARLGAEVINTALRSARAWCAVRPDVSSPRGLLEICEAIWRLMLIAAQGLPYA